MPVLLFFVLISWNLCHGETFFQEERGKVWIKAPQMPLDEFLAEIQSSDSSQTSYAEYLLKSARAQAKSYQLKEKLMLAQELYLSGEGERALKAFQKITDLSLSADWDKEDRRIILYSFLRRAQSERDSEKRKALLLSAIHFHLYPITKSNYPDYDLFPPPLMEEMKLLQEKTNRLQIHRTALFPHHEVLLINGQLINENTKINQASYRVSAFSSSHKSWMKTKNLSELITQQVNTKRLTQGPCNDLQISEKTEEIPLEIFPYAHCPKTHVLNLEPEKTKSDFNLASPFYIKNSDLNKIYLSLIHI